MLLELMDFFLQSVTKFFKWPNITLINFYHYFTKIKIILSFAIVNNLLCLLLEAANNDASRLRNIEKTSSKKNISEDIATVTNCEKFISNLTIVGCLMAYFKII